MSAAWTRAAMIATSAVILLAGCGSSHHTAASNTSATPNVPYAQGGPGFDITFTGAVAGHGTPRNAGSLRGRAPAGTVGAGAGLAGCGRQPATAQRFAGAYWLAGRVNLPQFVVFRVVVPRYAGPGTFPAAASPGANPPGTAIEVDERVVLARSGQITITDARSGTVSADFATAKGLVHVTGSWRCP
jgi:hypothetical protein